MSDKELTADSPESRKRARSPDESDADRAPRKFMKASGSPSQTATTSRTLPRGSNPTPFDEATLFSMVAEREETIGRLARSLERREEAVEAKNREIASLSLQLKEATTRINSMEKERARTTARPVRETSLAEKQIPKPIKVEAGTNIFATKIDDDAQVHKEVLEALNLPSTPPRKVSPKWTPSTSHPRESRPPPTNDIVSLIEEYEQHIAVLNDKLSECHGQLLAYRNNDGPSSSQSARFFKTNPVDEPDSSDEEFISYKPFTSGPAGLSAQKRRKWIEDLSKR
ncbi:hypothetical protein DFP72DRAFT_904282 [Ephemerocybe angulata]|uniref:Uncharacterized protein n=1 Tax=Ephemerocybe angulata TaxID=980116 RepID=A0A8H6HTQ9_9AGAR|nr:hypothetical protein DFP72DRAFT_904282 [Tulosesus angulatus]